jgi:phosphoribosylformimino-5-aminoimidazole carboxamide ribotide isomerase
MGGCVVRARMGQRDAYRPIETPLSPTPNPVDVVRGIMRLAPFSTLYIADLDAIQGRGDNREALVRLRETFPRMAFWIDTGARDHAAVETVRSFGEPVLGSESQQDLALLTARSDMILSLDFRGGDFLGPPEIWARPEAWPQRIIVMTLASIGAGEGPDLKRIRLVQAVAGHRQIYAAGGLRDARDLAVLKDVGVAGTLVASALHDGKLVPSDLS